MNIVMQAAIISTQRRLYGGGGKKPDSDPPKINLGAIFIVLCLVGMLGLAILY